MVKSYLKEKLREASFHLPRFGWKIIYDWSFSLSSLIAYNLLGSLLPLILCLFSIASFAFADDPEILQSIRDRLVNAFPDQGISAIVDALLKTLSKKAGLVFFVTFVVSIFTSSRLLIGIDDVLTIIYRIPERSGVQQNIHAIKMLLAFIILMPILILSSSAPALLTKHEGVIQYGSALSSGIFGFLLFELIYYYMPNRDMYWRDTWCGALFAAVGLQILLIAFPIYIHIFMSDYIGQLGFIIIAVLFFYLFGLLLVIGAQINAYFFDHIEPLTTGLGTLLSRSVNRENALLIEDNLKTKESMSTLTEGFDLNP